MTIEGRPETRKIVRTTRTTKFMLVKADIEKILIAHLRKVYPEFRGYADDEIEATWMSESIAFDALREEESI